MGIQRRDDARQNRPDTDRSAGLGALGPGPGRVAIVCVARRPHHAGGSRTTVGAGAGHDDRARRLDCEHRFRPADPARLAAAGSSRCHDRAGVHRGGERAEWQSSWRRITGGRLPGGRCVRPVCRLRAGFGRRRDDGACQSRPASSVDRSGGGGQVGRRPGAAQFCSLRQT